MIKIKHIVHTVVEFLETDVNNFLEKLHEDYSKQYKVLDIKYSIAYAPAHPGLTTIYMEYGAIIIFELY